MKPCAICCCLKCSMGESILMSSVLSIACTIAQMHLKIVSTTTCKKELFQGVWSPEE